MNAMAKITDTSVAASEQRRLNIICSARTAAMRLSSWGVTQATRDTTLWGQVTYYADAFRAQSFDLREGVRVFFDAHFPGGTDEDLAAMSRDEIRAKLAPALKILAADELAIRNRMGGVAR